MKTNIPLKIPYNNSFLPQQLSFGPSDILIDKNNSSPPVDSIEFKLENELKNLKNIQKQEKMEKLYNT